MRFDDKDGQSFEIKLRAAYGHIKNQVQLKAILNKSINAKPANLAASYHKCSYMQVMRDFGILQFSKRILKDK